MRTQLHKVWLVTLFLTACAQPAPSAVSGASGNLQDRDWVLLRIEERALTLNSLVPGEPNPVNGFRNLTLVLRNGTFVGYDGCNAFGGDYTATTTFLTFTGLNSSTRGCDGQVLTQADAYVKALLRVAKYQLEGDALTLRDVDGKALLWFTEADADYRLTLDLAADRPVNLSSRSKIKLTVWGYDQRIADQAPTALATETFSLPSLEASPTISFAEEDLLAVEPSSGQGDQLAYFITFDLDADGDGQVCLGDYRQNYNRTNTRFYGRDDDGQQVEKVFLTEVLDEGECRPF